MAVNVNKGALVGWLIVDLIVPPLVSAPVFARDFNFGIGVYAVLMWLFGTLAAKTFLSGWLGAVTMGLAVAAGMVLAQVAVFFGACLVIVGASNLHM